MSHIATVQLFVTDLAALKAACAELGMELVEGAKTYTWYGRFMGDSDLAPGHDPATFGTCEHKIRRTDYQAGDYEIGLVRRVDGGQGWELLYDNWGTGGARCEAKAGRGLVDLKRTYATQAATRQLQSEGYQVIRTTNAAGEIVLTATM
jgi:hypothetical protein